MHEPDDQHLVATVLAGEVERYADLVRRHHRAVCRMVARGLGGRQAIEELVHDVFVAAYRSLGDFDQSRSFEAWLQGIARHQILMRARTRQRAHRLLESYRSEVARDLAGGAGDAHGDDDHRHLHAALVKCQEDLAPWATLAITLRYRQGRELADVAAALGRSVDATRQLLYRIRGQLRACVEARSAVQP